MILVCKIVNNYVNQVIGRGILGNANSTIKTTRDRLVTVKCLFMKWFKCFIAGENFPGALANEKKRVGFYVTRFVEADSPQEAEQASLSNLKNEERLKLPEEVKPDNDAKVYFEGIEEISHSEVPETQPGVTFYVMGT